MQMMQMIGNDDIMQAAINEANVLVKVNPALKPEKDEYLYRSYLGVGQYNIILNEVKDNAVTPIGLRAIKLLANYFDNPSSKDQAVTQIKDWLSDPAFFKVKTLQTVAAILYMYDDNCKEAIKSVAGCTNMEQ